MYLTVKDIQNRLNHVKTRRIHCIGLGGIGVSGLAEWLLGMGFSVSGSDLVDSSRMQYCKSLGMDVFLGHDAAYVEGADLVIYTSAAKADHPERVAAKKADIPSCSRGEMLAALVNGKKIIAVSGTHGKTTTTSLTAHAFQQANIAVNYYVGGTIGNCKSTVSVSDSPLCVLEADESDASFLHLEPQCVIVTNVDADHLNTYENCEIKLQKSFLSLLSRIPAQGLGILCGDDAGVKAILPHLDVPHCTYGFSKDADYRVVEYSPKGLHADMIVQTPAGDRVSLFVPMPGEHNALNMLAAWLAYHWAAQSIHDAPNASWETFPGVARRFTVHGDYALTEGSIHVVEDYGHHPTEIEATIQAARLAWPKERVTMIFQPHRYTRTSDLKQEFIDVLATVDQLILMPIYAANEEPILGIDSESLAKEIAKKSKTPPVLFTENMALMDVLNDNLKNGDVLLLQGAGSVGGLAGNMQKV